MMDIHTSRGDKGISFGELRHKTMLLPRNRLSDITNLSIGNFGHGLFKNDPENGKAGSPMMVNEYIAKLLKENNVLMRALAERNTEVQNLRLMVAKQNQQNCQLAQAHSQMLAELNLSRDRLKAAQHELGCTSTVLKVKSQELEEQKKSNKQNIRFQNMQEGRIKPAETAAETSHRPIRKRPNRTQSLMPMPVPNQTTTEETRRSRRRPSNAESFVPTEDLFEIEDAKFPMRSGENEREEEVKDAGCSAPTIPIKSEKEIQLPTGLKRASLGRPLRRAAEKINCYKEMPLNSKLRRSE